MVLWYGMVYGIVWCMVLDYSYGMVMVWYGTVWYGTRYGTRYGPVHGTVWCSMVQAGTVWYGTMVPVWGMI